jgi:hypothetical protein
MAIPKEKLNERLNELINYLDDKQLSEIVDFAEFLNSKADREFWDNLPEDDEPLTEEDLQAIKEAEEDLKAGKTISHEEFLSEYEKL